MSDETKTVTDAKSLITDVELEFAKVKLFWAKYGHPAIMTLISVVSAYLGHKL